MKTKQEQAQERELLKLRNIGESCKGQENCENKISVDVQKLSRGLKTTFEGVAMIFDSLGKQVDVTELNIASTASGESATSEENPKNEKSPKDSSKSEDTSELIETTETTNVINNIKTVEKTDATNEVNASEISAEISAEPEHIEEPEKFEGQVEAEQEKQAEQEADISQDLKPEAAKSEAQQSPQPEEEKSSISHDDIVRLVAKKLKETLPVTRT